MEYLPEWKIYLWKKLLLNKEKFYDGETVVGNFMFFSDEEQYELMHKKGQQMINAVQRAENTAYNNAFYGRAPLKTGIGTNQSIDDDYYSFHPIKIMGALVELMDSKPQILSIVGKLGKSYIAQYRNERNKHLAQRRKIHLASIGMGQSGSYNVDDNFNNDPFCGLGEAIYKKAEEGLMLTSDEFRKLAGVAYTATYDHITLELKINESALQARLATYLDDFMAGNLVAPLDVLYFEPNRQRKNVHASLLTMTPNFGTKNLPITPERIEQYGGWTAGDGKHYRLFETLLSLEKTGEISIKDLRKNEFVISLADNLVTGDRIDIGFNVEKEKRKIVAIKFAADLKKEKDKWFNMKGIIDAVHENLPPVGGVDGVIAGPIVIDNKTLTLEQRKMLPAVLKHAYDNGAMTTTVPKSSAVISSETVRKFLAGENILIEDLDSFDDYRQKVNDLCNFIEQEVKKRFPEVVNNPETNPVKELSSANRKKSFILGKLKDEWDLTPKKPVTTPIRFGYYYTHPAGEAKISQQKFSTWMSEGGVSDWYELESILIGFQERGLISEFKIQNEYE